MAYSHPHTHTHTHRYHIVVAPVPAAITLQRFTRCILCFKRALWMMGELHYTILCLGGGGREGGSKWEIQHVQGAKASNNYLVISRGVQLQKNGMAHLFDIHAPSPPATILVLTASQWRCHMTNSQLCLKESRLRNFEELLLMLPL